jgi:hypothetical protein
LGSIVTAYKSRRTVPPLPTLPFHSNINTIRTAGCASMLGGLP